MSVKGRGKTIESSLSIEFVRKINALSMAEKGPGRPPHWEMIFWWTRKPLAGARAIIASSILPEDSYPSDEALLRDLFFCVDQGKSSHRCPPNRDLVARLRGRKLLDPFAGFGSIPLEALRLGLDVTAVELLPTAYVFLKAVLEYPRYAAEKKIENKLIEDVKRWGEWVASRLKEDPDVGELYEDDVAVYIGTWEIQCPVCGRYTPLVGNWWLARVKKGGGEEESGEEAGGSGLYERLAWMEPIMAGDKVDIRVRDLNRELGLQRIKARVSKDSVEYSSQRYRIPQPNIVARSETASCLFGHDIPKKTRESGGEWHIKWALNQWNQNYEKYLKRELSLDQLLRSPAKPRLLVKARIKGRDPEFEPCTEDDNKKLWIALEKLRQIWGDPDIPTEQISPYESRSIWVLLYGFDKWYKLFNPRQLLTLAKLVKLIREAGKKIEEEKQREGLSREEAHRYAEAITTYLAIALCKYADYSSLVAGWNQSLIMGHSLSMRGVAMIWNWDDMKPWASWTGTFSRNLSTLIEGLSYLVSAGSGGVRVVLDDAVVLSRLGGERFDVIVTDPPYADDVPYVELSDFYYVWLKRALSDSDGSSLMPRFVRDAFFRCLDESCTRFSEIETQWREFAEKEVGVNESRSRYFGSGVGSYRDFQEKLAKAFSSMVSRLADDGLLVTYYAHTDPEAWASLLYAGWVRNGLMVSRALPMATESMQRVTARGKIALDTSIVVVWRRGSRGSKPVQEAFREAVEVAGRELVARLSSGRATLYGSPILRAEDLDFDLFIDSLGIVLREFTKYERLIGIDVTKPEDLLVFVEKYAYPAAAKAIVSALSEAAKTASPPSDWASSFYILVKALTPPLPNSRRRLDRSTAIMLSSLGGREMGELEDLRIVERSGDAYVLLEPRNPVKSEGLKRSLDLSRAADILSETLSQRGVDGKTGRLSLRSPVDVLHYLEYAVITKTGAELARIVDELESMTPHVGEALKLARILAHSLREGDLEKHLCNKIITSVAK